MTELNTQEITVIASFNLRERIGQSETLRKFIREQLSLVSGPLTSARDELVPILEHPDAPDKVWQDGFWLAEMAGKNSTDLARAGLIVLNARVALQKRGHSPVQQ